MSVRKRVISVVLAGGFGTRLFPLTDTKPKPLVKILDKTVLENVICGVKKAGVERIIVSTFYKTDMIEKKCREIDEKIVCKKEKMPLGTAGGVKNCCDGEGGFDAVLVVSGDGVFDFELRQVVDYHTDNGNDVTIVTSHKENPTEYGVVICDSEDNVISFDEKPSWKRVKSDCVNTGIYIISKDIVDSIPDKRIYDFSKNLFPRLLKEGKKIKAISPAGFWCDIGTHEQLYACNLMAAKGNLECISNDGENSESLNRRGIHTGEDVYVSKNASIGKNVRINSASIICTGAIISDNCDISESIVSENTVIGKGSSIFGAIIGENVAIGENCIVSQGAVIGGGSRIADGTVIEKNTCIGAQKTVTEKEVAGMEFLGTSQHFVDDGKIVMDNNYPCRRLCDLAEAISAIMRKNQDFGVNIGVMCREGCTHLKNTFSSVLLSRNNNVFDCGMGNEAVCSFAAKKFDLDLCVYLSRENESVAVTIFDEKGELIDENQERKITKVLSSADSGTGHAAKEKYAEGKLTQVPVQALYENMLSMHLSEMLSGAQHCGLKLCMQREGVKNNPSASALFSILQRRECEIVPTGSKETVTLLISDDGKRASVRYSGAVYDHEHICAVVVKNLDILGIKSINTGRNTPVVLKEMAGKNASCDSDIFSVIDDGCACLAAFVSVLKLRGDDVTALFSEIPAFEIFTDEYIADINRGATMERLSRFYSDSRDNSTDGIRLCLAQGNVTVIPSRAKGFKLISEAVSMEAAKELAFKIGKVIKNEDEERK